MSNERNEIVAGASADGFWFGVILTSLVWYFFII